MFLFWISTLIVFGTTLSWLIKTLVSNEDWRLFSPFGVLMLCYLFYCAVGPWIAIGFTEMRFLDVDFYQTISISAGTALISFVCACIGYRVFRKRGQLMLPEIESGGYGFALTVYSIFFGLFLLSQKGSLNQVYNIFGGASESDLNQAMSLMGFQTYLYLMMSCCVAPSILMWVSARKSIFLLLVSLVLMLNLLLAYLSTGFRLRIVFLALAFMSLYFLRLRANLGWFHGRKKFVINRLVLIVFVTGLFVVTMSTARKYGRGLDLDSLKDASTEQVAVSTFNDAVIYFCTGQVVEHVRTVSGCTFFETYKAAALRMVPSALIGEKPLPKTIEIINESMGGRTAAYSAGFAVPYYAENYISFGLIGLVAGSFALGVGCAKLANMAIRNPTPYNLLFYALMTGFIFVYFHRGYFPQALDYFMFMVGVPLVALLPLRKQMRVGNG